MEILYNENFTNKVKKRKRGNMAKIKVKINKNNVYIRLKLSMREKLQLQEIVYLGTTSCYGLLCPQSIGYRKIIYSEFRGMSIYDYLQTSLTKKNVIRIIEQFLLVTLEIQAMGLNINNLQMNIQHSYIDIEKNEIRMIYSTLLNDYRHVSTCDFIKEMLNNYKAEKALEMDFKCRFIEFLNKSNIQDVYEIEDFLINEEKNLVQEIRREYSDLQNQRKKILELKPIENEIKEENEIEDDEPTEFNREALEVQEDNESTWICKNGNTEDNERDNNKLTSAYYREESVMREFNNREFEKSNIRNEYPILIRKVTNEKIYITKPMFRIGRELGKVDYCVYNNKNVSREHIDLIKRNRRYYVVDLNSKNKTSINEEIISANTEWELHDGDTLKLGDEEFLFSLN